MEREKDVIENYLGREIVARNIFWNSHLDRAWQAVWRENSWRSVSCYGPTPQNAINQVKKVIKEKLAQNTTNILE